VSDEDDREPVPEPSVGKMVAGVAILVALVILVFFAIGYLLGRLVL